MRKIIPLLTTVLTFSFSYPSCNMCHNNRIAPNLSSMSANEIYIKLIKMKNSSNINPKMAFIKNYSNDEIKKMVKQLKEKK